MVEAYIAPIAYSKEFDTKIEKPDFFVGLINYGKFIGKEASVSAGSATIYSVPAGKTFFLASATITASNDGTSPTQDYSVLYLDEVNQERICEVITFTSQTQSVSISFAIPIKLRAGQLLGVFSQRAAVDVGGVITGYEIDDSLIPLFT